MNSFRECNDESFSVVRLQSQSTRCEADRTNSLHWTIPIGCAQFFCSRIRTAKATPVDRGNQEIQSWKNHSPDTTSYTPQRGLTNFWENVVEWQEETHIQKCRRLYQAYTDATQHEPPSPENDMVKNALRSAVKSAEMNRRGTRATAADAFQIRNIFNEPALRELVNSEGLDPSVKQLFRELEADMVRKQPIFPPSYRVGS